MSADTWQTLGTILALVLIGGYNAYRAKRAESAAKESQTVVRKIDHAVGNGFSRDVMERLARIEHRASETHRLTMRTHELMVEHLSDHVGEDMRKRR